jgi:DNA gyrase subunit A
MKGYEIPEYGRTAKGIPIINLLGIDSEEKISAVVNVSRETNNDDNFLFFTTLKGTVKRTPVSEFTHIRNNGLKSITLKEGDSLIGVSIIAENQNMIIGTHLGYAVSFRGSDVRSMGRSASGVRGIRLRDNDYVIGVDILEADSKVFIISEKGFGKQTSASEYPIKGRGGKGIKTANVTAKNGPLAGMTTVSGDEDIMLVTDKGVIIRFDVANVSQTGRATLGVHLIKMDDDTHVATMTKVAKEEDEYEDDSEATTEGTEATVNTPETTDDSSTDK